MASSSAAATAVPEFEFSTRNLRSLREQVNLYDMLGVPWSERRRDKKGMEEKAERINQESRVQSKHKVSQTRERGKSDKHCQ